MGNSLVTVWKRCEGEGKLIPHAVKPESVQNG